jgi:hypothetical protein
VRNLAEKYECPDYRFRLPAVTKYEKLMVELVFFTPLRIAKTRFLHQRGFQALKGNFMTSPTSGGVATS